MQENYKNEKDVCPQTKDLPLRSGVLSTFVLFNLLIISLTRFSTLIVRTLKNTQPNQAWAVFMYAQRKFSREMKRSLPSLNCGNQLDQHPWRRFSSSWTTECTQHRRCSPCCLAHNPRSQSVRKQNITYMCPPSIRNGDKLILQD